MRKLLTLFLLLVLLGTVYAAQQTQNTAAESAAAQEQSAEPDIFAGMAEALVNPPEIVIEDHSGKQKAPKGIAVFDPKTGKPAKLEKKKRLKIKINISDESKITLNDAIVEGEILPVRVEEVPATAQFKSIVAIDLEGMDLSNATYYLKAKGYELFKCKLWNFTAQKCDGSWVKIKDTVPGKTYAIKLGPNDPALADGNGVFFDGFENGLSANNWTINGTGNKWTNATTDPFNGTYHAQANQPTAGTTMRINISTQNYTSITLNYAIRLVGIDAADEFQARWYNGTVWQVLEATGSAAANNANYIVMNFTLGSSADNNTKFALEFTCQANIANEYCRVDDVRVNGTSIDKAPPTIWWTNLSSAMPYVGDSLCILANVSDNSGVNSVNARISLPNGSSITLPLYDALTCNSEPEDGVFSNHIIVPVDGTYNWTIANATDKAGNTATAIIGSRFDGILGMPQIYSDRIPPNLSRYDDGTIIDTALINTSNNVYATQNLPKNTETYMYFNWTLNVSGEIIQSNATIEHRYSSASEVTVDLQIKNGTAWQNVCFLTVSASDVTDYCNISAFVQGNTSVINNLELRTHVTTGNQARTQYVDYVSLEIEVAPPNTLIICGDVNISKTVERNISSESQCLKIGADNVDLNCNGYTISYNSAGFFGEGITATGRKNITIRNCVIRDTSASGASSRGILLDSVNGSTIINNTIQTNGTSYVHTLLIQGASANNLIKNNTFRTGGNESFNLGIYFTSTAVNNTIVSNRIITNGTGSNHGILLQSGAANNTIANNTITTGGSASFNVGIYLLESASGNILSQNSIATSGNNSCLAIYIDTLAKNNSVINNSIRTGGIGGFNVGIYLSLNSAGNAVSGNLVNTSGTSDNTGIILNNNASANTVSWNSIQTGGTGGSNEGILLIDYSSNNNITSNAIFTNGTGSNHGILLQSTVGNNTVLANKITTGGSGAGNVGIYLVTNASENTITGNLVNTTGGGSGDAVRLSSDADINIVANNTLRTNGTGGANNGIFLSTFSEYNSVSANNVVTGGTSYNHGILLQEFSAMNNFTNNNISAGGTFDNTGIYMQNSSSNTFSVHNITATGTDSHAIRIIDSNHTIFNQTIMFDPAEWISAGSNTFSNFTNTTFEMPNGSINIPFTTALNGTIDITKAALNISMNRSFLNSITVPFFNTTGIILLRGINESDPDIAVDYEDDGTYDSCPAEICTILENNQTLEFARFNVSHFTSHIIMPKEKVHVINLSPYNGEQFLINGKINITANATASSQRMIDTVIANITKPDGSSFVVPLLNQSKDIYNATLRQEDILLRGRYNVTFIANDTKGKTNATVTAFFARKAGAIIDLLGLDGKILNFSISVMANNSGVLDLNVTINSTQWENGEQKMLVYGHSESSPYSIIKQGYETNESTYYAGTDYSMDFSLFNFSLINITQNALAGDTLYKSSYFNITSQEPMDLCELYAYGNDTCDLQPEGLWDPIASISEDFTFSYIITNATDPGFAEYNTSTRENETNTTSTTPVTTLVGNFTPSAPWQYVIVGFAEMQAASNAYQVYSQLFLNDTSEIGNFSRRIKNGRVSDPPGDYLPFFTHKLINLSANAQNLTIKFWTQNAASAAYTRRERTIAMAVNNSDAVGIDSGDSFTNIEPISPAKIAVANISYTPTQTQSLLVLASAELAPFSTSNSLNARLMLNNTEIASSLVEGLTVTDTFVFAAHTVIENATANVQQNFTIQGEAKNVLGMKMRRARISVIPLAEYYYNSSENSSYTTSLTYVNKTFLYFNLNESTDVLIIGTAQVNLPTTTSGRSMTTTLFLDGQPVGNMTSGSTDFTDIISFIAVNSYNLTNGSHVANIALKRESGGGTVNLNITAARITVVPILFAKPKPIFNFSNITVTKTDRPDPVNASQNLTYQINVSVTNNTAYNVTVNDTYSTGIIYLTSQPTPLAGTNNTWILGNLTQGTNISINITVLVLNLTNGTLINNTVNVSFQNETSIRLNRSTTINTTVLNPPLFNFSNITVTKTDRPDPVNASSNLSYQINVSNTGNGTAYNVTVNDTYPNEVIYLISQPTPLTGTNNTWILGNLTQGTNISINITVLVLDITNGTLINNTVNASFQNETSIRQNISTRINTTVLNPPIFNNSNISATKTSYPNPVNVSTNLTYQINITSNGNGTAYNVTVIDTYPNEVIYTDSQPAPSAGNNTWALGSLVNGTTVSINITVLVQNVTNGMVINNTANITWQNETSGLQNVTARANTTVQAPIPTLHIYREEPDGVGSSKVIIVRFVIWNDNSSINITDSTLVDNYPAGWMVMGLPPEYNATDNGQNVTVNIGQIPTDELITFNYSILSPSATQVDTFSASMNLSYNYGNATTTTPDQFNIQVNSTKAFFDVELDLDASSIEINRTIVNSTDFNAILTLKNTGSLDITNFLGPVQYLWRFNRTIWNVTNPSCPGGYIINFSTGYSAINCTYDTFLIGEIQNITFTIYSSYIYEQELTRSNSTADPILIAESEISIRGLPANEAPDNGVQSAVDYPRLMASPESAPVRITLSPTIACNPDYFPTNIIDKIKYALECQIPAVQKKAAMIPADLGSETDLIMLADHKNSQRKARIITSKDTATGEQASISKNKHHTVEINLEDGKMLSLSGLFVGNSTQIKYERLNDTGFANSFAIDLSGLNFTTATITAVAQQPELYKCKEWDFAAQTCNGSWEMIQKLVPGSEYTITLTADDPGFGEFNSSTTAAEQQTTATTPQNATVLNFTPTISQYVLIGFGEVNHNGTTNDARARLQLNITTNIGNLSWEPASVLDYAPFFTHQLVNLNANLPQILSVQYWTEAATAYTKIRRATAVALGIRNSDAVTNETSGTFQGITPAGVWHSVANLSYTPTVNQLLLVISSAELWPNKTNESIMARLMQNGTEIAFVDREGKDVNDIVPFATHLIVNATANVQQNFSLQANAEIRNDKAIRRARITIVPLNASVFYNATEAPSSTTSTTAQNKTFLWFTLPIERAVLIIGSARLNISNAAGLNVSVAQLFLDETLIGNMTKFAKDTTDDFAFIAVQQTSLSAGAHSLRMTFNRDGTTGTVAMANARISVIDLLEVSYNFTNITVTKTDSPDPVNASSSLTYQINVTATGNGSVYNVTVNDTYPVQVIYLTSQPAPVAGTNNTWIIGNLTRGTNFSVNITVLVFNLTNGTVINNTVNTTFQNETSALFSTIATQNTTVVNRPPSIAQVILNSTNPLTNFSSENLTMYVINATDADGTMVQNITDWKRNSTSIALLNMPFETNTNSLATGAVRDYSLNGNNGTLGGGVSANAPLWNGSGKVGGSYQFDGINDFIQVSGLLGQPASATIAAWVNWAPKSTDTEGEIVSLGDHFALRVSLSTTPPWTGVYGFYYDGATWQVTGTGSYVNGTGWHHVAYTFDNATKTQAVYVDGVLAGSTAYTSPISYPGLGSNTFIGKHGNAGTTWDFNGTIDETLVFNRSLSAQQVYQLYLDGNRSLHMMTIVPPETLEGEIWQACATPNDNLTDGSTVCSNNVTIGSAYITWSNPSINETTVYWNSTIRFNTTWTSAVVLSGYKFAINQSGWTNSSFVPFGGLTNTSENITTITADEGTVVQWYFWANNSLGKYNQTDVQSFTVQTRPTSLIFNLNQSVYAQGYGNPTATQYYIPINARYIDSVIAQPISGASCNATNNETSEILALVYIASTGNYTGNLTTYSLYDNVTISVNCGKKNYVNASNQTSTRVWFITYLLEDGNLSFDQAGSFTTFLKREAPSGGLYTNTINSDLAQGDNLIKEFNYCGTGTNCSLDRDYQVTNGIFSMKLNMSINDTVCRPYLCYFAKDPAFNKIYEDCYSPPTAIPANTATIVENNITDTHTLPQGYFLGISLYLNCSSAVSEQVKVYYNYTGEQPGFIITHPKPVEIVTFIPFSAQVEKNYTIGPNQRINETRMAVITFNNTASTPTYIDYTFTPRIYAEYTNSVVPNTTHIYNSTGQLWASDNASAGAPGVATVYSNNQVNWRTETIPNQTLKNETTQSVLLDCARDDEILIYNTTTEKIWNISLYSILTTVVPTYNLTVWTNYSAYDGFTGVNFTANISNSSGTFDITSLALINTTTQIITFPNLTLVSTASIMVRVYGQPLQKPYVKIVYPLNLTFNVRTSVPIVANISDPLGITSAYANVTLPNGTIRNATFGKVQQPDSFGADTLNTSWFTEAAIGAAQTCYLGINESVPGMALTGISGNGWPYTLGLCSIISKSIAYGDFDTNISFALMNPMENDTDIVFGFSETPTSVNTSRAAYITLAKRTGVGEIYLSYANDGNISGFISTRFSNDTFGKFRIQRSGTNFSFYSWNNTGSAWITEASTRLNMSSVLYVIFASGNNLPAFGALNASWDNFSINTFNYSVAFFNETNLTGIYNATAVATNSINGVNNTEKTNFTIAVINHPPSIPYILLPSPGQVISGLYNITWMQVSDPEGNSLQFNITLLNADGSFNATIVSNYGNSATTKYEWNTTNYPNGEYVLKVTVFENETTERYATSDTMAGNFTLGHMPDVVVIAPINESFPDRRPVSLVINASDPDHSIDTAIASVTLPNGSVENLTMGDGQVSDNFSTDTMGTYWDPYSYTGPSQICTADIDTTVPGKAYISLSGDGSPETDTYCVIGSSRALDGDFDINVSFDILSNLGKDGILNFALTEVPDPTTTAKTIFYAVSNWSGYEPGYEVYANDGTYSGYPLNLRLSNDTAGKLRIKRTGNNFTFYFWSGGWIEENLTQSTFDFARGLYVSFQLESSYPGWGERNVTFANFGVNSANVTFAIFNNTIQIGNYNVSFIVNDTLGITNRDAYTNFSVYLHNDPPSVPWILAPYVGEIISGLFNITWTPSVDEEGNSLQFNITLLNPDFTDNSTIVSHYGDENSTNYEWNTSQFPDGIYSMNVTVFETSTPENLSNSNVLDGNFTVDNTPPNISLGECVPNPVNLLQIVRCNATVTDALAGISAVTANITLPNGSVVNVTVVYQGNDVYNFSYLTAVSALHTVTWRANDTVTTGRNNVATATATFTVGVPPTVVVIAPINKSFPDRRPVSLVINASSTNGIDTAIASVTLPNGSVENLTMGYRMVSDNFSTDTMGTYWNPYSYTGPSQICTTDIDTTVPGKAYVSLSGDGTPETDTYCMISSAKAVQGDFDINVSFDILSNLGKDGILNFALTEVPDPTTTTKTIFIAVSNWSGYEPGYEVYANDGTYAGYPLNLRLSNDTAGKLRIKRTGNNFTFYTWSSGWIQENLTQDTFDFARSLYISLQLESSYPGWGERNVTFADFGVNSANVTFAIFNNTIQIGNYNVSFIVNDTLGITNRDAFTNFSVYEYNDPPSVPWILAPYIGETISGLYNITWSPVTDEEGNSLQFNITLLNADFTYNSTIVSNYGNDDTVQYEWNTATVPSGEYSLNVTVFENDSIENKSNSNVLEGTFWVDNTPPAVTNLTPTEGTNYSQNLSVNISAVVIDLISGVDVVIAEVVKPNGQYINYTLANVSQETYLVEFNDTNRIGQYNVTIIANDTMNNINRTETTFFVTYDTQPPAVFDPTPTQGYGAYLQGNVSVSAIATDNTAVSRTCANITLPNGTVITMTQINDQYASDNSTLLLLHLNEETGQPIDNSGNSITSAFTGTGYTQNVTGKFSKAVQFAGSDAYINASNAGGIFDFGSTENFTLEAWVNPADIGDVQPIACKLDPDNANTPAYVLSITDAGLPYFTIRNATGGTFTATATTNVLGALHHVAGVRDAASQQCLVYVDGVLEATASCPAIDTTNSQDLLIGIDCDTQLPFNGLLDEVRVSNATRTGFSPDYYIAYYANLTQRGRYNITYFANDTRNNINATTTTYFVRKAFNVIDLIDYNNNRVYFTISFSNSSGVLNVNITPNSTIKKIQATQYYESSPNSILRIGSAINESLFPLDTNYTLDASGINFTTLNITRTATSGTIAYKCANFNTTTESCMDLCPNGDTGDDCPAQPLGLWAPIANIIPGQDYTFLLLNTTDPGFAEWNASQRNDEINTTSASPVAAIQSNITPTLGQYLLIGYGELQGSSNFRDIGALLSQNDTTIIGNATWQPDTNRTGNPPGDYAPFFTHQIANLSPNAQNLSIMFFGETGQTTFIRRARAINMRINNSDALTNDTGSTLQTITPASVYHSIANLSYTPTSQQPILILATAEVAPNSVTQSVLARLLHNGTERAYLSYEGKAATDITIFATQLVVNATANVQQNFTLQAQSETAATKQFRRARITAIPLSEVYQNESLDTTQTTSSISQNKTFLYFTLPGARNALIMASADVNISSCTNGNFLEANLNLDGSSVGNLTQGCKDNTDVYSFITAQLTNLSAGAHTAVITFRRSAGSGGQVAIRRARITVVPVTQNNPPRIAQVILNTTDPLTNDTDQNLTAYIINVTDLDNDAVKNITDWRQEGVSIAILNMPFEGGSSSTFTRDYSMLGNNGSVVNAVWNASGGYDGFGAYQFNGANSYINLTGYLNFTANNFTTTAWFLTNVSHDGKILSTTSAYHQMQVFTGKFRVCINGCTVGNKTISDGQWHFAAVIGNSSGIYAYLDGNSSPDIVQAVSAANMAGIARIGAQGAGTGATAPAYYFNGRIDEVMAYNRTFSVEEIQVLYANRTDLMVAQQIAEDQNWSICVTPNDKTQDGATVCSNNVTIRRKPVFNISNISATKTDYPDPVNVSTNLTYQINITSSGNGTAYNVTVNDTYPNEVIYLASQPTPLAGTNNTWILGNLTPGTNRSINITVLVLDITNGTIINNTANITFQNETSAQLSTITSANTTVIVPVVILFNASNISVTKTDDPDPVSASSTLSYQINISSNGNATAYNVTVNDTYPAQVIYLASQPTPLAGTNNTWILGNLTPGTNISINITVLVLNLTNGTIINNTANVSFQNETSIKLNRSTTINTTVLNPPLFNISNISATKTDYPDPVNVSTNLTYQINITSSGNGTAYNVTVNDTYPNEVIYLASQPTPLAGTNNTWILGNLTPGTNRSINITVLVLDITNGTIINNTANITFQNETSAQLSTITSANTTVIVPVVILFNASNISVTKTDDPDPVSASSTLSYQINVSSNGNGTSSNVTVNDTYPAQVIYLASQPTPLAGTNNTWILGNLTPGTNISINITVLVLNLTNGTIINNTVNTTFQNTTGLLLSRIATQNTTVLNPPVLNFTNISVTKTDRPDPVTEDSDLYYQINISSTGNGTAYSATATDTYPPQAIYVTASPTPDFGTNNTWSLGTLAVGANLSINITVHVPNGTAGLVINNTVNVNYVNETGGSLNANATANTTVYAFRYFVETIEQHFIRVREGVGGKPDLQINNTGIFFNNSNPDESENITINATVCNIGSRVAQDFNVTFADGNETTGIIFANLTGFTLVHKECMVVNATYISVIGNRTISVLANPNKTLVEINYSNNLGIRTLNVKAHNFYFGKITGNLTLANANDTTKFEWNHTDAGLIYLFTNSTQFNFSTLQAIGRNTTNGTSPNDFISMNTNLNMTRFNDSMQFIWAVNTTIPQGTRDFTVFNRLIENVPVINSTNTSSFVTGILWDTEHDTNGYYDTVDNEPIVFIANINLSQNGQFASNIDYEARIPTLLRAYIANQSQIVYIVELD